MELFILGAACLLCSLVLYAQHKYTQKKQQGIVEDIIDILPKHDFVLAIPDDMEEGDDEEIKAIVINLEEKVAYIKLKRNGDKSPRKTSDN